MDFSSLHDPIAASLGAWSQTLGVGAVLFRMALTIVLTAVIGCERSSKRHSAGLRTFILVGFSTCVAMMLDIYLCGSLSLHFCIISAACVVAVSTISVNSLLFSSRNQLKGLTTSVGLWSTGILGLCCGAGLYSVTLAAFAALLLTLSLFPPFETYLKNRSNHFEIHLELKNSSYLQNFVTTLRRLGLRIDDIEKNPAYVGSGLSVYSVAVTIDSEELKKYKTHNEIIEALSTLEYVYHMEEMRN